MFKKIIWIAAITCSLFMGQTVFAHDGQGMKQLIGSLNLDAEQKAKIKPILEQLTATMKDNWSQIKDIRMQMNQQIASDTMDKATVDSLIDKKIKLIGDMMKAKASAKHQIFAILTPKQKATFQAMVKKWEAKVAGPDQDEQE
ncbi:MAG: Spy/CpxP family protein refolding chaperone [bacterium]|nr:Spy/CpxP family protein refolding chaperone [bacterium]